MRHKFTADGSRVSDYSPCPEGFNFGQSGNTRPGPDFDRLKSEVDLGRVWISATAIGQSLPISRSLRTFDANGALLAETGVAAPGPGAGLLARGVNSSSMAADALWAPFVLKNGEFLFEWRTLASSKSGPLARYVSLHDAAGKALASASALPSGFVPALVNRDGLMVFVTIVGGTVGLVPCPRQCNSAIRPPSRDALVRYASRYLFFVLLFAICMDFWAEGARFVSPGRQLLRYICCENQIFPGLPKTLPGNVPSLSRICDCAGAFCRNNALFSRGEIL